MNNLLGTHIVVCLCPLAAGSHHGEADDDGDDGHPHHEDDDGDDGDDGFLREFRKRPLFCCWQA